MGINTFFLGTDATALGRQLLRDALEAVDQGDFALGRAEDVHLSHDRGVGYAVDFLRGYAAHLLAEGQPMTAEARAAAQAQASGPAWRRLSWQDIYGEPEEVRSKRFAHLCYTGFACPDTVFLPVRFATPKVIQWAPPPPDPELGPLEPSTLYLGSSAALLDELNDLNQSLGASLEALEPLWEQERAGRWDLESVDDLAPADDPFAVEKEGLLRAFVFATLAVKHKLAIVAE